MSAVSQESVAEELAKAILALPLGWRLDQPKVDQRPMKLRATWAKQGIRVQVFGRDANELADKARAFEKAAGPDELASEVAQIEYSARLTRGGRS